MSALTALQQTLAGEHAAVYGYATWGGRVARGTDSGFLATVASGHDQHRAHRDQLRLMITDLGATPVASAPSYDVGAGEPRVEVLALETRCAEQYAAAVAHLTGNSRSWATAALTWSAVHQLRLGQVATPWPGAPELA